MKTKILNTKNPQIKHYSCPTCIMIYNPDLYNLQTRKKQLKKKLRIETDSSYYLTTRNLQYHHWP